MTMKLSEWFTTGVLFAVHSAVGTIGVPVAASVLRYSLLIVLQQFNPSLSVRAGEWMQHMLMETPYFPVQIFLGLLLGFQLGRRYEHKVVLFIWIFPALTLILLVLFAPFPPSIIGGVELTKLDHFFGWSCLPQNHCFEQVGVTLPLYSAASYSLGALIARAVPRVRSSRPTVHTNGEYGQ